MTEGARAVAARRPALMALVLLIGVGAVWGLSFSLAKLVTQAGVRPLGLAFWHALGGVALLAPYCAFNRWPPLDRPHLRFFAVTGLLGSALPAVVLFAAAPHLPAGVLAAVTALVPLITYGMALGFRIERYRARRAAGLALGLVAVGVITLPARSLPGPMMAGWVLFALIAPLSYAGETVYLALRRPPEIGSSAMLLGMLLVAMAMLAPLAWASGALVWPGALWSPTLARVALLVVINTSAYLMYVELIRIAGPVFSVQAGYLVTATGVAWGMVIFDERHSPWFWLALALMFAGLALVTPPKAPAAE